MRWLRSIEILSQSYRDRGLKSLDAIGGQKKFLGPAHGLGSTAVGSTPGFSIGAPVMI